MSLIPRESRLRALVWNRLLKGEPDYLCLTYRGEKKIFHQSATVLRDFEVQTEQTSNQVLRTYDRKFQFPFHNKNVSRCNFAHNHVFLERWGVLVWLESLLKKDQMLFGDEINGSSAAGKPTSKSSTRKEPPN